MDKTLYLKLYEGYEAHNEDEIKHLNTLVKADIVKVKDTTYTLDSKYKIGTITFQKKLCSFTRYFQWTQKS